MRLYAQTMLLFLPMFLFAVAVMGAYKYFADRDELMWGQETAADAYAVSIAEYLTPERLSHLAGGIHEPFGVFHELDRIVASDKIRRLAVYSAHGFEPLFQWGERSTEDEPGWLLEREDEFVSMIDNEWMELSDDINALLESIPPAEDGSEPPVMRAAAPVQNGLGALNAVVLVELDSSAAQAALDSVVRDIVTISILVILIAVLASIGLSFAVGRSINQLTRAIQQIQSGRMAMMAVPSSILEIRHFENTYNTMVDVLIEEKERDRNDLMQIESVSVPQNIHPLFNRTAWPARDVEAGPLKGLARVDEASRGAFVDLCVRENSVYGLIGEASESDIEGDVAGVSAVSLWRSLIEKHDPPQALETIARVLQPKWIKAVVIEAGAPANGSVWSMSNDGSTIDQRRIELPEGTSCLLHTFRSEAADVAEMIARRFGSNQPSVVADRIAHACGGMRTGAILIVKA